MSQNDESFAVQERNGSDSKYRPTWKITAGVAADGEEQRAQASGCRIHEIRHPCQWVERAARLAEKRNRPARENSSTTLDHSARRIISSRRIPSSFYISLSALSHSSDFDDSWRVSVLSVVQVQGHHQYLYQKTVSPKCSTRHP